MNDISEYAFVIGDTETAGLPPHKRACEVGLREICPITLDKLWEIGSYIDPEIEITEGAFSLHGISNEMVASEPTMAEFREHRLGDRFAGRKVVLICHNVPFDLDMLEELFPVATTICTLAHARRAWPKAGPNNPANHRLETLAAHFGIETGTAHRALGDVHTTHGLLRKLLDHTGRSLMDLAFEGPVKIHVMPFGEHKGKLLINMPKQYLQWMAKPETDMDANLKRSAAEALLLQ
jgi:DNA polymerase III epsilon subunit-like protein